MKHETLEALTRKAEVTAIGNIPDRKKLRRDRLERWASLLEKHQGQLNPLERVEYLRLEERGDLRGANSPLTVAFQDPVLRAEGLASDRLGDAIDFFSLTQDEAHYLLCDCHYSGRMSGSGVASHVRAYARRMTFQELVSRVRDSWARWW